MIIPPFDVIFNKFIKTIFYFFVNKLNDFYLLNYWHILISKGSSGFTSNTLFLRIQYCYQFKYFTDKKRIMSSYSIVDRAVAVFGDF